MLGLIECLKESDMSIKDIKNYAKFTELGDDSLKKCSLMFLNHKKAIE